MTKEFAEFFKIVIEGETFWNSFTIDRIQEASRLARMRPLGKLHSLPPPALVKGLSSRARKVREKVISDPISTLYREKMHNLESLVDEKDYCKTLLVDDGSLDSSC